LNDWSPLAILIHNNRVTFTRGNEKVYECTAGCGCSLRY